MENKKWISVDINSLTNRCAIYRWVFTDTSGNQRLYIGETKEFKSRIRFYTKEYNAEQRRKYGNGDTDIRLGDLIRRYKDEGGKVDLMELQFTDICGITPSKLSIHKVYRLAVESLMIIEAREAGFDLENK